ncbi:MAG: hypothetical protein J0I41_22710 [Filimonas sp.]|nr:hypothetical protein [Filimonas sp.]
MIKYIKPRYYIRHEMLRVLKNIQDEDHPDYAVDMELTVLEMSKRTGIEKSSVNNQVDALLAIDEVYRNGGSNDMRFMLSAKGNVALQDRKYPRLAMKEFAEELFDIIKIVSTALAIFISIYTLTIAIIQNAKNAERISALETEVRELRAVMQADKTGK